MYDLKYERKRERGIRERRNVSKDDTIDVSDNYKDKLQKTGPKGQVN